MTGPEVDGFLTGQRTCRVATTSPDGPHATPLWFAWDGTSLWLHSLSRSQRWTDWERDNRVAVVIDDGHDYGELRGVELRGRAVTVGEVPRTGEPSAGLAAVESLFARKYYGGEAMDYDGRHAWRRVTPEKITSWDFRKIPR
jgi:nitroimidazol reductase NimA-like FMN-containing flavoprotein (pyridoxamine 5'-phosphate oxidase superfamily)